MISPSVVAACRAYVGAFGTPSQIYYPACGNDSSPSQVFTGTHIVYLDINGSGLAEIREQAKNPHIVKMRAEEYMPRAPFDLVLSIHSHAPFDAEIRNLRYAGHLLIANKMSDKAFDCPQLELVAAIMIDDIEGTLILNGLDRFKEIDPDHDEFSFSNRRLHKAQFYVFRKIA